MALEEQEYDRAHDENGMRRQQLTQETLSMECEKCKEERKTRVLVANSFQDERFLSDKFVVAPAILANNDIKYEVNKLRAQGYASK